MDGLVLTWAYHGGSEVLRYGTAAAEITTAMLLLLLVTAVLIAMDLPAWRAVVRDHFLRPPALGSDPQRGPLRVPWVVQAVAILVVVGATFGFQAYLGTVNVPDEQLSGVWLATDDQYLDRPYIDEAPYCAVRPEGSEQVWRGVCFVDEQAQRLEGDLLRRPGPDATEAWELDASYRLSEDGRHLHLDDHARDVEVELRRHH